MSQIETASAAMSALQVADEARIINLLIEELGDDVLTDPAKRARIGVITMQATGERIVRVDGRPVALITYPRLEVCEDGRSLKVISFPFKDLRHV